MTEAYERTRRAYRFLSEHNGQTITAAELAEAAGWAEVTARTYIAKSLGIWLTRSAPGHYLVSGMGTLPVEDFIRQLSQVKTTRRLPTATADEGIQDLEAALRHGESETVEFKEEFPKQAHGLAQEVAALARKGGDIWLGVANDHSLTGLHGMEEQAARNQFRERIEGVIRSVRPAGVGARITWVEYGQAVICRVQIKAGDEPIYYYDSRPYLRDGSHSRPAEPNEVKSALEEKASQ